MLSENGMVDEQHEAFLEDAFVLEDDGDEEGNILELVGITCDTLRKSKEFSDAAIGFAANPKNKKAAKHAAGARSSVQIIVKMIVSESQPLKQP